MLNNNILLADSFTNLETDVEVKRECGLVWDVAVGEAVRGGAAGIWKLCAFHSISV